MELQVLEARYVDLQKLVSVLTTTSGLGRFKIETQVDISFPFSWFIVAYVWQSELQNQGDEIILTLPRHLTPIYQFFIAAKQDR